MPPAGQFSGEYRLIPDLHRPRLAGKGTALPSIPAHGLVRVVFDAGFGPGWTDVPVDLRQAVLLIGELEKQMKQSAKDLEFEKAAALRDQMYELRAMMVEDSNLTPLQKMKILSGEN